MGEDPSDVSPILKGLFRVEDILDYSEVMVLLSGSVQAFQAEFVVNSAVISLIAVRLSTTRACTVYFDFACGYDVDFEFDSDF